MEETKRPLHNLSITSQSPQRTQKHPSKLVKPSKLDTIEAVAATLNEKSRAKEIHIFRISAEHPPSCCICDPTFVSNIYEEIATDSLEDNENAYGYQAFDDNGGLLGTITVSKLPEKRVYELATSLLQHVTKVGLKNVLMANEVKNAFSDEQMKKWIEIQLLCVASRAAGKGVAELLMQFAALEAVASGYFHASLRVSKAEINPRAIAFYKKLGFFSPSLVGEMINVFLPSTFDRLQPITQ